MRNLKKTFIFALMLTMSYQSYSQTFGIKGGLNFANMLAKDAIGNFDTKMLTRMNLGVTAEFGADEKFSFETGALLSFKGAKEDYGTAEGSYKITYLDIPLMAKLKFNSDEAKFYGKFGPYLGIGLSGQSYDAGEGTKIKWGTSEDGSSEYLKKLDYGISIGAGVELGAIDFGLTYSLGLANISGMGDDTKIYNRVLSLSVGYKFGKNKTSK